jgi:hypothetical protein
MGTVLGVISSQGYIYDLSKGYSQWVKLPPPRGTRINCRAAAILAKRLAEEQYDVDGDFLKIICAKPKGGFIVLSNSGIKALGTTNPEIKTKNIGCWEFDNHYRVKDTAGFNKIYDPIFGSSGNLNPQGIKASSDTKLEKVEGTMCQITEYGEKYRVIRSLGAQNGIEVLNKSPVDIKYIVTDQDFV